MREDGLAGGGGVRGDPRPDARGGPEGLVALDLADARERVAAAQRQVDGLAGALLQELQQFDDAFGPVGGDPGGEGAQPQADAVAAAAVGDGVALFDEGGQDPALPDTPEDAPPAGTRSLG
ncbi:MULTISPECIES: hypothetical protein [unclassified Streptomyces]|uniref:hypothetical protein n=1 Tax=unclassified Streptomyces TaxID=2593676 RepID=UPI001EF7556A|nr:MULTISPECIES: hypothetical protein [unclassified Streptomyces]